MTGTYALTVGGAVEESSSSLAVRSYPHVRQAGWTELRQWPPSSNQVVSDLSMPAPLTVDVATGRITTVAAGTYIVLADVQVDGASAPISLAVVRNNQVGLSTGMWQTLGADSPSQGCFSLVGLLRMEAGDFLSLWLHDQGTEGYTVNRKSGFHAASVDASSGFGSGLAATQLVVSAGWTEVVGWQAGGGGLGGFVELGPGLDPGP